MNMYTLISELFTRKSCKIAFDFQKRRFSSNISARPAVKTVGNQQYDHTDTDPDLDFLRPSKRKDKWKLPEPKFTPPGARWKPVTSENLDNLIRAKNEPGIPKWKKDKLELKVKIGGASWDPRKKLSPEARNALRAFKSEYPHIKSTEIAQYFGISPESVRRILKSRWLPWTEAQAADVNERWAKRQDRILDTWSAIGRISPKRKETEIIEHDKVGEFEQEEVQTVDKLTGNTLNVKERFVASRNLKTK
ncbi:hypothetical protein V1512DRAFT_265961 [Lipomyces arxii]|uniref:uncharacterized protein n=1 Tax=Lipomyces arxii TaxID=56418 RepID=UPI0034CDCDC1